MLLLSWDALSSYSETLLLMSIRPTATCSDKAWANTSVSASFHPSSSGRLCPREYVADAREKTGMPGPIASQTRRATYNNKRIWFARLIRQCAYLTKSSRTPRASLVRDQVPSSLVLQHLNASLRRNLIQCLRS
jgi:hypothetical protein